MSYPKDKIVELVSDLLRREPSLSVAEASQMLNVHRHTLQRALTASGQSFALIRQSIVLERLERHSADGQPTSLKQLWTQLGFTSASAFARYIRHATGRSPSELRADYLLGHPARKRADMYLDH